MSYKDIDLAYIDGILDAMRQEYQGSNDIPMNLRYYPPKDYTILEKRWLSTRVRNCWLASKEQLEHIEIIAAQLNRKIVPASGEELKPTDNVAPQLQQKIVPVSNI